SSRLRSPDTQPDIRGAGAPNVIAEAAPHSWPWVASLRLRGHHRCSGAILSSDWVLTSARCADLSPDAGRLASRRRPALPRLPAGAGRSWLAAAAAPSGEDRPPPRLQLQQRPATTSPCCDSTGLWSSAARAWPRPACQQAAPMPTPSWTAPPASPPPGGDLSSSGVGDSPRLQQVLLPIVPNWLCSNQLQHGDVVTDASICAGWGQAGSPRCQGDGGQPLVCWRPALRLWQLLGVNSWTDLCTRSPRPGLFTRVSAHLDWVRRAVLSCSVNLTQNTTQNSVLIGSESPLCLHYITSNCRTAASAAGPPDRRDDKTEGKKSDSAAAKADVAVADSTPALPKRSREAAPHSWPWMASLRDSSDRHHCGGSVITERWVLTAAHCFNESEDPTMWSVDAGRHCHNCSEPAVQRRALAEVVIHPAYNASTLEADLALLLLESPLDFSGSAVAPATLAASAASGDSVCTVTGWGLPRMDASEAEQPISLQEVAVPIVPASVCSDEDHYGDAVDSGSVLCAGYELGGGDACKGYSGGPLVCRDGGASWLLHGVTSWGDGCALPRKPTVYIRVEAFIDWIRQTVHGQEQEQHCGQKRHRRVGEPGRVDLHEAAGALQAGADQPGQAEPHQDVEHTLLPTLFETAMSPKPAAAGRAMLFSRVMKKILRHLPPGRRQSGMLSANTRCHGSISAHSGQKVTHPGPQQSEAIRPSRPACGALREVVSGVQGWVVKFCVRARDCQFYWQLIESGSSKGLSFHGSPMGHSGLPDRRAPAAAAASASAWANRWLPPVARAGNLAAIELSILSFKYMMAM
uniref:Peptidase S1 domain-containing protein n=1 Tax=Macrostomum lignano TaxID=282301 RepID=A0A1I8IW04_9PLAT